MALNERQDICYQHTFKVFRHSDTKNPTSGKRSPAAYAQVGAENRGLYSYTQNDDDGGAGAGRVKRRSELTEDQLEGHVLVDIKSQDFVVDTSRDAGGNPLITYGTVHKVQGEPRRVPSQGEMELDYFTVKLMSTAPKDVPAGVEP